MVSLFPQHVVSPEQGHNKKFRKKCAKVCFKKIECEHDESLIVLFATHVRRHRKLKFFLGIRQVVSTQLVWGNSSYKHVTVLLFFLSFFSFLPPPQ